MAGIGLAEVFLRVQEPYLHLAAERVEWTPDRYRTHPIWHHWLRPNTESAQQSINPLGWPSPMVWHTNAQGCRHAGDLSRYAPPGTRRIIVMGDSFTEGYYQDTTFAAILARRLASEKPDVKHEVVNCGTSSYSPLLYYLRYKHQLSRYHPHELIVNLDLTDIYDDNHRYGPAAVYNADGEPLEALPSARGFGAWIENLKYRFHIVRLVFGRQRQQLVLPETPKVFEYHSTLTPDSARWQKEVGFSLSLLQRLIDLTKQEGVALTFTMYPYRRQFEAARVGTVWHREFEFAARRLAERNGVDFFSAYNGVRAFYDRGTPLYWTNDFHFNPLGQYVWGNLFADYYLSRKSRS
jgi:lysophospholipase L1-like esterase